MAAQAVKFERFDPEVIAKMREEFLLNALHELEAENANDWLPKPEQMNFGLLRRFWQEKEQILLSAGSKNGGHPQVWPEGTTRRFVRREHLIMTTPGFGRLKGYINGVLGEELSVESISKVRIQAAKAMRCSFDLIDDRTIDAVLDLVEGPQTAAPGAGAAPDRDVQVTQAEEPVQASDGIDYEAILHALRFDNSTAPKPKQRGRGKQKRKPRGSEKLCRFLDHMIKQKGRGVEWKKIADECQCRTQGDHSVSETAVKGLQSRLNTKLMGMAKQVPDAGRLKIVKRGDLYRLEIASV